MKTVFMLFLVLLTAIPTWAWDTTPNKKGKYDKFYERPTHFPDFKQPGTWPNAQYYMVMPSMNSVQVCPTSSRLIHVASLSPTQQAVAPCHGARTISSRQLTFAQDMIIYYNSQISMWEKRLADMLTFVVKCAEGEFFLTQTEQFKANANKGTVAAPYVLQLDESTSIANALKGMPAGVYFQQVFFDNGQSHVMKMTR